jgi:hypothetical protein
VRHFEFAGTRAVLAHVINTFPSGESSITDVLEELSSEIEFHWVGQREDVFDHLVWFSRAKTDAAARLLQE